MRRAGRHYDLDIIRGALYMVMWRRAGACLPSSQPTALEQRTLCSQLLGRCTAYLACAGSCVGIIMMVGPHYRTSLSLSPSLVKGDNNGEVGLYEWGRRFIGRLSGTIILLVNIFTVDYLRFCGREICYTQPQLPWHLESAPSVALLQR